MSNFLSRLFKPSHANLEMDLIKLFYKIGKKYHIPEKNITGLLEQKQRRLHPFEAQAQAALIFNLVNLLPRHFKHLKSNEFKQINSSDALLIVLSMVLIESKDKSLDAQLANKIIACEQPFWELKHLFDKLLPEQTLTETHQLAFV